MNFNLLTYVEQTDRVCLIPKADVPYKWTYKDQEEVESGEYLKTKDSIKRIVVAIAKEKNLITRSRKREIVDRRKYLFHVLRDRAHVSLSEIGRIFSKDHATVLHGLKSFDQIKSFPDYQENVREISSFLNDVEPLKKPMR